MRKVVPAPGTLVTGLASDGNGWISSYIHLGEEDPVTSGLFNGDFEGGAPVQISDALNPAQGPAPSLLLWGGPMALLGDIVLVSQTDAGAIVAIDRVSGDRVILSM
jgi:hypothetical protein